MPPSPAKSHGWWPYLGPYGLFLLLVQIGGELPDPVAGPWLAVKVALPGALFLYFLWRGDYPELRGYRPGWPGLAADLLCGLVVVAIWMGPFLVFDSLPRPGLEEGFDASLFGPGGERYALGLRLVGFAFVTPFVEELFVRSFLIRYADVYDTGKDFRKLAVVRFTWRSFLITVFWFTFSHVPWEWGGAAVTGVLWNLWLLKRGHIGSCIVAHAVANGTIWAIVVHGPPELGIFL